MLSIAINPYSEPLKKFWNDLKITKWKFPYILQFVHAIITIFLLALLLILYLTIGIISQISNSFWDLIIGLSQKMSFSNPIESSFYALSATIYFLFFLPFFIIQYPIWLSGWLSSKIGFKPFITLLLIFIFSCSVYLYRPQFAYYALDKIVSVKNYIKTAYFDQDSLNINNKKLSTLPTLPEEE